jgi:hypothetical protein
MTECVAHKLSFGGRQWLRPDETGGSQQRVDPAPDATGPSLFYRTAGITWVEAAIEQGAG